MSKATLKKAIKDMDAEQLREMILELYENRPEAKEYLEYWTNPDPEKVIEEYKKHIYKLFFISEGRPRKSPNFQELKKLLKYFMTLYLGSEHNTDMKLYAVEIYTLWLQTRNKVMSQQKRIMSMCDELYEEITADSELKEMYALRYDRMLQDLNDLFERGDLVSRRGWRRYFR